MVEISKNGTFLFDKVRYLVYRNLKGAILAVNAVTKDMVLIFSGLEENNTFINLKDGLQSLCPEKILGIFPKLFDEITYGNYKILLMGKEHCKYMVVYVCKLYVDEQESLYDIQSISEVKELDEVIFYAPNQHRIIPLGVTKRFTVRGCHIV